MLSKRWMVICALLLAPGCGEDSDQENEHNPVSPEAGGLAPLDAALPVAAAVSDAGSQPSPEAGAPKLDAGPAARDAGPNAPLDAGGQADASVSPRPDASAMPTPADAGAPSDAGSSMDAGPVSTPAACAVVPIPETLRTSYKMGAIYKRYADANGVPVIASDKPSDESIHRACLLIVDYSSASAKVREVLLQKKVRFIMMAKTEKTVNFPEYASLGDLDWRARGLGGVTDGICAEENILCDRATDRWRGESICVHEFAHTMQLGAYNYAFPNFQSRIDAAYKAALAAGKFANTYAGEQPAEYWAEGVQDWYNTNIGLTSPNGVHNHINTRAELEQYDPTLYGLLKEVLPDKPSYRDCYYYE